MLNLIIFKLHTALYMYMLPGACNVFSCIAQGLVKVGDHWSRLKTKGDKTFGRLFHGLLTLTADDIGMAGHVSFLLKIS